MSPEWNAPQSGVKDRKRALNARLEEVAWALFFIMLGVLWLMGEGRAPETTWLVGAGAILLTLNVARLASGIGTSGFSIILGLVALAIGLGGVYGIDVPIFPILFILVGVSIILKPMELPDCCKHCFEAFQKKTAS